LSVRLRQLPSLTLCSLFLSSAIPTPSNSYVSPHNSYLTEAAYDAIKKLRNEDKLPKEDLFAPLERENPPSLGWISTIRRKVADFFHVTGAKAIVKLGDAMDWVMDKKSEAHSIMEKSNNRREYIRRVNLRLGVTYPDVPMPGNEPVTHDDSLRKVAMRLYTLRHVKSASLTGAESMASTHEGDRQYWHAMASTLNGRNSDVYDALTAYLHSLYDQSREVDDDVRWWYYGRMLHAFQDSHSDAHCARDTEHADLPIHFFQDYSKQSMGNHGMSDTSPEEDEKKMAELITEGKKESTAEAAKISKILKKKKKLYARAEKLSAKLLNIVWDNGRNRAGEKAADRWFEIMSVIEQVFNFDVSSKHGPWRLAAAGGSLPLYAADPSDARELSDFGSLSVEGMKLIVHPHDAQEVTVSITKLVGRDMYDADLIGTSDPFIVIKIDGEEPYQTEAAPPSKHRQKKNEDQWILHYELDVSKDATIHFTVYDSDTMIGIPKPEESDLMGKASVHIPKITKHTVSTVTLPLKREGKNEGELDVTVRVDPVLVDHGAGDFDNPDMSAAIV
jgi:C2 domain